AIPASSTRVPLLHSPESNDHAAELNGKKKFSRRGVKETEDRIPKGTSNSSVVNVDDGSSNAGDEDSCSTRAGDAFAFDFSILRVGSGRKEGKNRVEFVTRQLFPMDGGGGGELTQEQSSRPNWVDLTFGQARFGGGFESFTTAAAAAAAASEEEPTGAEVAKLAKLEVDGFQLGTKIATTGDNSWPMPVNLKRLIWNTQKTFKVDLRRSSDMHLMEIVEAVDKLQERLKVVTGDDAMSMEAQKNATLFFSILLCSTFARASPAYQYGIDASFMVSPKIAMEIDCRGRQRGHRSKKISCKVTESIPLACISPTHNA
ncbi:hypothetical protein RJ640_026473, partial [Escallonia rubra]